MTSLQTLPWKEIKLSTNKYLPRIGLGVLIILLVQIAAEITWKIVTPAEVSSFNITHQSFQQNSTQAMSLDEVSRFHLFGDAKKQVVVEQKIIEAPETRLRLTLKGVFSSTTSENSLAIISDSKDKEETYHIGDTVSGGAVLHAVYNDRVILKRNGQLETLRLPKLKVDTNNMYHKSSLIEVRPDPVVNLPQQDNSRKLRELRDTLLKEPAKIWKDIRINPVMKDGQVRGYSFMHNDQELMKSLDIRKTDVILQINGESLSDPSSLYGLMNSLSTLQTLDLMIERDGQPQSIQLNFD